MQHKYKLKIPFYCVSKFLFVFIFYSDQLALTTCMTFISRATFNASAAILQVPASKPEPKLFKEVHDDNVKI